MHAIKYILVVSLFLVVSCSNTKYHKYKTQPISSSPATSSIPIPGTTIPGTNTVLVKIGVDVLGVPTVSPEIVVVRRGQRVIFVGPDKFTIKFPTNTKPPFDRLARVQSNEGWGISTDNAVINLSRYNEKNQAKQKAREQATLFKYDIIVNGKELDPYMIFPE